VPVLSGSFPVRRYSVVGSIPTPFWDHIQEGLTGAKFVEPLSSKWSGSRVGLVTVDNLLETDFYDRKWMSEPYVFASLRIDTKSPPAPLVKAELDRRCKAWRIEKGAAHIPREVKREIKEQVTEDVLATTSARTKTVDFVWNVVDNWVTLGHLSDSVADQFVRTFQSAFGVSLTAWSPFGEEVPAEMPGDFYLWLWWAIEHDALENVEGAAIDGKIVLTGRGSETSCTGEDVEKRPEPRSAVMDGKRPSVVKIKVTDKGLDYAFTMSGSDLHIAALKLPEAEVGRSSRVDREASILDRLGCYENLHGFVAHWASTFQKFYNTKAYHEWVQSELGPWLQPKD